MRRIVYVLLGFFLLYLSSFFIDTVSASEEIVENENLFAILDSFDFSSVDNLIKELGFEKGLLADNLKEYIVNSVSGNNVDFFNLFIVGFSYLQEILSGYVPIILAMLLTILIYSIIPLVENPIIEVIDSFTNFGLKVEIIE